MKKPLDSMDRAVRLGCGGALGLLLGASLWRFMPMEHGTYALVAAGLVVACALGALLFGDRFWQGMSDFLGQIRSLLFPW